MHKNEHLEKNTYFKLAICNFLRHPILFNYNMLIHSALVNDRFFRIFITTMFGLLIFLCNRLLVIYLPNVIQLE